MANWIRQATRHKGGLHRSLGVPEGKKIPVGMIEEHVHDKGKVGKQARLAMTLRGMHHGFANALRGK
jgi:hypothetical protein